MTNRTSSTILSTIIKPLTNNLDLLHIATHFVVHEREPVRHPELEDAARLRALVYVDGLEHALRDVHAPARLKPVVLAEVRLLCDQIPQFRFCLAQLTNFEQHLHFLFNSGVHGRRLSGSSD